MKLSQIIKEEAIFAERILLEGYDEFYDRDLTPEEEQNEASFNEFFDEVKHKFFLSLNDIKHIMSLIGLSDHDAEMVFHMLETDREYEAEKTEQGFSYSDVVSNISSILGVSKEKEKEFQKEADDLLKEEHKDELEKEWEIVRP